MRYLHSDIDTLERVQILRDLRLGTFDVLVGINLLREGLDLPEVSLVAILDADKEGFLRSAGALIQTIGRAARNVHGRAILYADVDDRLDAAARSTRPTGAARVQEAYNAEHGITPASIIKNIDDVLSSVYERDYVTVPEGAGRARPVPHAGGARRVHRRARARDARGGRQPRVRARRAHPRSPAPAAQSRPRRRHGQRDAVMARACRSG